VAHEISQRAGLFPRRDHKGEKRFFYHGALASVQGARTESDAQRGTAPFASMRKEMKRIQ
jgi:hypothetical protein